METPSQAEEFRNQSLLYLYCIDLSYVFELKIPSLPFLKLECVFAHVSFPSSLSERRMVVLPRSHKQFGKLKDITSPCVIETISSVDFEVIYLFFLYSIDLFFVSVGVFEFRFYLMRVLRFYLCLTDSS